MKVFLEASEEKNMIQNVASMIEPMTSWLISEHFNFIEHKILKKVKSQWLCILENELGQANVA